MDSVLKFLAIGGDILFWSLISIVVATIISLLVIRVILGIKFKDLLAEIETKQNAAVGIIFKNIAAVASGFCLVFASEGFTATPATPFQEGILWATGGGLLTIVLMLLLCFVVLTLLARREHLKETPLRYLRRELVEEQNEALAHIIMALLIVVGISVIGQVI
jgi:hypothetical protein